MTSINPPADSRTWLVQLDDSVTDAEPVELELPPEPPTRSWRDFFGTDQIFVDDVPVTIIEA